ncbi:hypothetical protein BCR44DRAFT_229724 [Catenaria anguillulae PL171]|uniref:Tetratricopeptide repeat protein 21A/21B second ARM domain-containing protein n=1 Tax=Catenaria anguillulae PL171 TaxID=765915 RepID=A0A1Y2I0I2_9FUNG|nr:hypothetical protein BCR44DRAFT_229724 [Catenaria anguillulae PL171]
MSPVTEQETAFDSLAGKFPKDVGVATGRLLALATSGANTNAATATLLGFRPRHPAGLLVGLLDVALAAGDWDRVNEAAYRILGIDPSAAGGARPSSAMTTSMRPTTAAATGTLAPPSNANPAFGSSTLVPTIDAHLVLLLISLLRDGNPTRSAQSAQGLLTALKREEPDNASILCHVLNLLVRLPLCAPIPPALARDLLPLAEKAVACAAPSDPGPHCTLARVAMRANMWPRAKQAFQLALSVSPHCVPALEGLAVADLALLDGRAGGQLGQDPGAFAALSHDVDLLSSMCPNSPTTQFLHAELAWRTSRAASTRLAHLRLALESTLASVSGARGLDMLDRADLMLVEEIASALVDLCPARPRNPAGAAVATLGMAAEVLTQMYPASGHVKATSAWAEYLSGNVERARERARAVVDGGGGGMAAGSGAFWSATQVLVHVAMTTASGESACEESEQAANEAAGYLDAALAVNLDVRKTDAYQVMRAWVLRVQGKTAEAKDMLANVADDGNKLKHPGDKLVYWCERIRDGSSGVVPMARRALALYPALTVDLQLTEAMAKSKEDPDAALAILREAANTDPGVSAECTRAMAHIYLNVKRDPAAYLRACQQLVDSSTTQPSKTAYVQLARAYTLVDDIDRAVDTLASALCYYPDAPDVQREIADVLLSSHEYGRALEYLQDAVAGSSPAARPGHVLELAKVYAKLGHHDRAEVVLMQTIQDMVPGSSSPPGASGGGGGGLSAAAAAVEIESSLWEHLALAQVALGKPSRDAWQRAAEKSRSPTRRAAMYVKLAGVLGDTGAGADQVEATLEQARQLDPASPKPVVALASLYLKTPGKMDQASALAKEMAAKWPLDDEVAKLLAMTLVHKRQFNEAIEYMKRAVVVGSDGLKELVQGKEKLEAQMRAVLMVGTGTESGEPGKENAAKSSALVNGKVNYEILAQLVDLLHRMDRLEEAAPLLDLEAGVTGPAAVCFCRGLYYQYVRFALLFDFH